MAIRPKNHYFSDSNLIPLCEESLSITEQTGDIWMKKILTALICATVVTYSLAPLDASARVKKNEPDKKDVLKELQAIGGEHYVDKMRIKDFCTLEVEGPNDEEIYYHVFVANLRDDTYRIIYYDNKPEYLGYYSTTYLPDDYEKDRVKLDSGESDSDGDTIYIVLPITAKGPADSVNLDGVPTKLIKNPNLEANKKTNDDTGTILAIPKEKSASGEEIDYRDWKITMKGKEITVNAKFEKIDNGKVYIKNAKNGVVAAIPGSALSAEDQEYVKRISAK
jgi:hypothetical protein